MTEQYLITVETISDILPGSGESRPGVADNDSRYDQYGLPYMNAKTLKGHLREQMELLLHVAGDQYPGASVESLLGETDLYSEKSAARIRISTLSVPHAIRSAISQAIGNNEVSAEEISYSLSYVRTQTKINNDGVTADGTLRQSRQIRKGLRFEAFLEADGLTDAERQLLTDAVCAIQHIGTGKSKGMGVVRTDFEKRPAAQTQASSITGAGRTIIYQIHLDEPVKVGGNGSQNNEESLTYIPGSMARGGLIGRLLRSGSFSQDELDDALRSVRFSDLTPFVDGQSLFACPSVYYADKHARRESQRTGQELKAHVRAPRQVCDLDYTYAADDKNPAIPQEGEQAIGRGQYASVQNGLSLYHVPMTARLHVAVNQEKMYRYEAIAAGQTYEGVIRCKTEEMADRLAQSLANAVIYLGGSRGSGYGRCRVQSIRQTNEVVSASRYGIQRKAVGHVLSIYALSNLILLDERGMETSIIDPHLIEKRLGITNVEWRRSYTAVHNVHGYNHTWQAGQVQRSAVAAGSILYYTYEGEIDDRKAAAFEEDGVGLRREDGFGSILVAPDFSGGAEEIAVHHLAVADAVPTVGDPNKSERLTLSLIEQRVNDYREDLALREAALTFASVNKDKMSRFSPRQMARLYSMLKRLPEGNSTKATNEIRAFEDHLKNTAGKMYDETFVQVGKESVPIRGMLSNLRNSQYDLERFAGQTIEVDHLMLVPNAGMSKSETYDVVFYQKVRFLCLALYDLMRKQEEKA